MKLLLIADDPKTADYVREGLHEEGHELHVVVDGRTGLFRAVGEEWDLLIIDRMLPGLDGLALVQTLRAGSVLTPVLFLTTMGGIDDRVTGLNAGGDDYLVQPFAFAELAAWINSERQLVERIEFDLMFRWFVDLGVNDPIWDATTFTKNRGRLLAGEVAAPASPAACVPHCRDVRGHAPA